MDPKINKLISRRNEDWRFPGKVFDTFSALYKIAAYDKNILKGGPLGKIAALLISIESQPGGPYYSEFPDSNKKRVIDPKTNRAIGRFLSMYDIELPGLQEFLHGKKVEKKIRTRTKNVFSRRERTELSKILKLLRKRMAPLSAEFHESALLVIKKTIRSNPDKQMSLMPYYMRSALGKKAGKIPDEIITGMGLVNIFFWTAFIIYDDFWDEDEARESRLLPIANFFARNYIRFFDSLLPDEAGFNKFFHSLMDGLDEANFWETRHCRARVENGVFHIPKSLPRYGGYAYKYRPASGHVLGPVGLLVMSGYRIDSDEVKNLIEYFKNYLIAMQMNDDLHDWEEDLCRGHISTAVDMLLRDLGKEKRSIDLEKDMDRLRDIFWFTTLPKLARKALLYTRRSRSALLNMRSIEDSGPLLHFINLNQKIAEKAISEHLESVQFLKAYGKSNTSR